MSPRSVNHSYIRIVRVPIPVRTRSNRFTEPLLPLVRYRADHKVHVCGSTEVFFRFRSLGQLHVPDFANFFVLRASNRVEIDSKAATSSKC